jgi:tetratricopeptide (TPR) repeat protein
MNRKTTSILLVAALVVLAIAGIGCEKLKARDHLNKGVQFFRGGNYPAAVENFKSAIALEPTYLVARQYLAVAYMMQYIPGAESPENLRMGKAAEDEFKTVLTSEPNNTNSLAYLAKLYFDQGRLDESWDQYKKLISIDPKDKTAYYTLGVIAWKKTYTPRIEARAGVGMKPDDPGPIKDKKVREALAAKNSPFVQEGLASLAKAMEVDPEYDDAMAYTNLLYREKADLEATADECKKDLATADEWVAKSMAMKKVKTARDAAKGGGGLTTGGK